MIKIKTDDKSSLEFGYTSNYNQIEEENNILRDTVNELRLELDRYRASPLMVCEVRDILKKEVIIKIPNGNLFLVNFSKECPKIKAGDSVFVEQKNLTIVRKASLTKKFNVEKFVIVEKPNIPWKRIGGLNEQINEIKEVVELPLKSPEMFEKVGIQPPKGVLLHGEPGTGKTLVAKAVATATNATFIEIVASELVQKFIGEGAKLVKDIFQLAREKAPSIVFIDELDALAAKRVEIGTSGEREVQRTFMQLLAEIDGFKNLGNVKIIGSTNRKDILDSAIIRPGRLERMIHFPLPNNAACMDILKIHSAGMAARDVNFEATCKKMEQFSGAMIKATCTEAGYLAIREDRTYVTTDDFIKAVTKVKKKDWEEHQDFKQMFG